MTTFWLAKTIDEIKEITVRTDYCRLFCVDWLDWVFYHPTYSLESVGDTTIRYENDFTDFLFIPDDVAAVPNTPGAWLRDTNSLLIRTTSAEWVYKPPTFRPYKAGQNVTLAFIDEITKSSWEGIFHALLNPAITSWTATQLPTNDVFNTDLVWMFSGATTVISDDNPTTVNQWGAGGVLWYDKSTRKLYINESLPKETEINGLTGWNEITFEYFSPY